MVLRRMFRVPGVRDCSTDIRAPAHALPISMRPIPMPWLPALPITVRRRTRYRVPCTRTRARRSGPRACAACSAVDGGTDIRHPGPVRRHRDRRVKKTLERQDKGYPEPLRSHTPTVDGEQWMSQFQAADALGVSMMRVGLLIQSGQLEPVHNPAGQAGVSTTSVKREQQRRHGAGPVRRLRLGVLDALRSLARGV
jgi:hypothetical protein